MVQGFRVVDQEAATTKGMPLYGSPISHLATVTSH